MRRLIILPWEIYKNLKIVHEVEPDGKYRRFKTECIKCGVVLDRYMHTLFQSKTWCQCSRSKWKVKLTDGRSIEEKKLRAVFASMKNRCKSKNHKFAYIYSLKWIKCEWKDFDEFYRDMWATYRIWLSIDRIDGNKNYCKENCRWADDYTQNNNRRNNIFVFPWVTLSNWARENWIPKHFVSMASRYWKMWHSLEWIKQKYYKYEQNKKIRLFRRENCMTYYEYNKRVK